MKTTSLTINIYPWDGNKNFGYEVFCQKYVTLRFRYFEKVHAERVLSEFESDYLKKKIKSIKFNLFSEESDAMCKVLPDTSTLVEIKNSFYKTSVFWKSSDELNNKKTFANLIDVIQTVDDMLPFDASGLELPMYW